MELSREHVDSLKSMTSTWLKGRSLSPATIIDLVPIMMKNVQILMTEKGQGSYKKELLLYVLKVFVDESKFGTDADRKKVKMIIKDTVPTIIDTIIAVKKGDIDILKDVVMKSGCIKGLLNKVMGKCVSK